MKKIDFLNELQELEVAPSNLLEAIIRVVDASSSSELTEDFFSAAHFQLAYLAERLDLSNHQAALFSIILDRYNDRRISVSDIARHTGNSRLQMLRYKDDFAALVKKGYIMMYDDRISVPDEVLSAIASDKIPETKGANKLDLSKLFDTFYDLAIQLNDHDIISSEYVKQINELVRENRHLVYCTEVLMYGLEDINLAVLCMASHYLFNLCENSFDARDFRDVFEDTRNYISFKRKMQNGDHPLIKQGILRFECGNGYSDTSSFSFTDKAMEKLFPDLQIETRPTKLQQSLIRNTDIVKRELFFNDREKEQIQTLTSLLMPSRFDDVVKQLKAANLRTGICVALYGAPGCGKTEAVNQIALATGRDIIHVDISAVKSKWVGESEQNLQRIFRDYNIICQQSKLAPILLFNEADALFSKRLEDIGGSVDQMSNSMQNILLENMERLEGILICTTNLENNFDAAFERRFLYKIKFEKPSPDTASLIWQSMLPTLTPKMAKELAVSYDFSGGQIENISRKMIVDGIISGKPADISRIKSLCDSENFLEKNMVKIAL